MPTNEENNSSSQGADNRYLLSIADYRYYNGGDNNGSVSIQPINISFGDETVSISEVEVEKGPSLHAYDPEWPVLLGDAISNSISEHVRSVSRVDSNTLEISAFDANISLEVEPPNLSNTNHYLWPELLLTSSKISSFTTYS